jgi:hypothetical protein
VLPVTAYWITFGFSLVHRCPLALPPGHSDRRYACSGKLPRLL